MITKPFNIARPESPLFTRGSGGAPLLERDWFIFFVGLYNAVRDGIPLPEQSVTVGASPYDYTATQRGQIIVSGGTVSAIALSRNGTDFYSTGQTAGTFQLAKDDVIRITHTGAPIVTFFPM